MSCGDFKIRIIGEEVSVHTFLFCLKIVSVYNPAQQSIIGLDVAKKKKKKEPGRVTIQVFFCCCDNKDKRRQPWTLDSFVLIQRWLYLKRI